MAYRYRSDQLQVKVEKRAMGSEKVGVFTWVLSYTFGKQMQADHRNDNWNLSEPLEYEIDDGEIQGPRTCFQRRLRSADRQEARPICIPIIA